MSILFFTKQITQKSAPVPLPPGLTLEFWQPRWRQPVPPGLPLRPFLAISLFHFVRGFASQEYAVVIIRDGGVPVAHTCVIPKCFRFPFMGPDDLQVVCSRTQPDYRGRGLGVITLQEVARRLERPGRKLWGLIWEANRSSIRRIEKAGFRCVGRGEKTPLPLLRMLGSRRFGTYRLLEAGGPAPEPISGGVNPL